MNSYSNKIIIFVDILGIKEFSLKSSDEKIQSLYKTIENFLKINIKNTIESSFLRASEKFGIRDFLSFKDLEINTSIISDTVVISFPKKYVFLLHLISRSFSTFSLILLDYGLLYRGSIVYGKIFQSDCGRIIYGKGLTEAAIMEKENKLPVIKICPKLMKIYSESMTIDKLTSTLNDLKNKGSISFDNIELASASILQTASDFINKIDDINYFNHFINIKSMDIDTIKKIFKVKKNQSIFDYFIKIMDKNIKKFKSDSELEKENVSKKIALLKIQAKWEFNRDLFCKNI
jgi:hypothetical protein